MAAGGLLCFILALQEYDPASSSSGWSSSGWSLSMAAVVGAVVGAWPGALLGAFVEFCGDSGEDFILYILPKQEVLLAPNQLLYSQDSVASVFQDGQSVSQDRGNKYSICACFHNECLFTLNNRTLYSAACNGRFIKVTVVEKPTTWNQRFTGRAPWSHVRVRGTSATQDVLIATRQAVRIPADAFPQDTPRPQGHVTLEVDRLIKATRPQIESLAQLMRNRCPNLFIEAVGGDRSYARVRVKMADEAVVRAVIKAMGRERGKRGVNIKAVPESRTFDSPRD